MPERILKPYMAYLDNLKIHYQICKAIGPPHQDRCSLPQGCPFSMSMVGLLMVPWIRRIREVGPGVEPRCLVDDLMITSQGPDHLANYIKAMKLSRTFFKDFSDKVADRKCFSFAGDQNSRAILSKYIWDDDGLKIPVVNKFRELGSHLNFTQSANGVTTTKKRMQVGIAMANRLHYLPLSKASERIVFQIFSLQHCMGLRPPPSTSRSSKPSGRVSPDALGQGLPGAPSRWSSIAPHRTTILTHMFTWCSAGSRSFGALWRSTRVSRAWFGKSFVNTPSSSPPPHPNRDVTNEISQAFGPVGLLLQDVHRLGGHLDENLVLRVPGEADINVWNMPWQHFKKAVTGIMVRDRTRKAALTRKHLDGLGEIDADMLKECVNKLGEKEQRVLTHTATGAAWSDVNLADIGKGDGKCRHCGAGDATIEHVLWHCKSIHKHRRQRLLEGLNPDDLPVYLKAGIPATMTSSMDTTFWGATTVDTAS